MTEPRTIAAALLSHLALGLLALLVAVTRRTPRH